MDDRERVSFPHDYDQYAATYAWSREAVAWVLEPLAHLAGDLSNGARVLEIGCGTGNYIGALSQNRRDLDTFGFDVSEPMLEQARGRGTSVTFVHGDATRAFPFPDQHFALAFAVDVIHHLGDLSRFFAETHRVLAPGGRLAVVTDSEATFRRRSLTQFFPEILPIELARYPAVAAMNAAAEGAGLSLEAHREVAGRIPIETAFIARLEAKCSSAMRLMKNEDFEAGMARVRAAGARGERWFSCYDVFVYGVGTGGGPE